MHHPRKAAVCRPLYRCALPPGILWSQGLHSTPSRGVRCTALRSVLHRLLQCTAFVIAPHCVFRPIVVRVPAQHFLLFTFHPSLPARTIFHFSLFTLHLTHWILHFSLFTLHLIHWILLSSLFVLHLPRVCFPFSGYRSIIMNWRRNLRSS